MNRQQTNSTKSAADPIPISEWLVSGLGLLLVLGSFGFLIYKAVLVDPQPPSFEARLETATQSPNGYLTEITVTNHGGETVADLQLVGEQQIGSQASVVREVLIDYLPAHSSRSVVMIMPEAPDRQSLRFSFRSFKQP